MYKKVLEILKAKTQAFGFNKEELKTVATSIAEGISLGEDAEDEEIDAEINKQVNAIIPFLQLSQSMATRVINKKINSLKKNEEIEEETEEIEEEEETSTEKKASKTPNKNSKSEDVPEWKKGLEEMTKTIKTLSDTIVSMQREKSTTSRKSRLNEVLKDSGSYGEMILKNFERMTFADDEAFEDFIEETQSGVEAYRSERNDSKLDNLSKPPKARVTGGADKTKVLTDSELDKLADSF